MADRYFGVSFVILVTLIAAMVSLPQSQIHIDLQSGRIVFGCMKQYESRAGEGNITSLGMYQGGVGVGYGGKVDMDHDLDNDGKRDLVVGAEGGGQVLVFFGPLDDNTDLTYTKPDALFTGPESFGSDFCIGDFNGDAFADIAVGSPNASVNGLEGCGAVYIFYGPINGGTYNESAADGLITGGAANASFGRSVAVVRDFDGDGLDDLGVGAPGINMGGEGAGAVFIFSLNGLEGPLNPDSAIFSYFGTEAGQGLGEHIYDVGDYNGDSLGDLAFYDTSSKALKFVFGRNETRSYGLNSRPIHSTPIPTNKEGVWRTDEQPQSKGIIKKPETVVDTYPAPKQPEAANTECPTRGHQGTTDLTTGLGSYCTASSYSDASFAPNKAVDDNTGTRWIANSANSNEWWMINLLGIYNVDQVRIYPNTYYSYWYPSVNLTDWTILGSVDGQNYVTLYQMTGNTITTTWVTCSFEPTFVRYIKITNIHLSHDFLYRFLPEIEIYAWENYDPTNGDVTIPDHEVYARMKTYEVTATYQDSDGYTDIDKVGIFINPDLDISADDGPGFLHAEYNRSTGRFYLYNDDDSGYAGSMLPGEGDLENSFVVLHCGSGESSVSTGGETITVKWVFEVKFSWGTEACYVHTKAWDIDGASSPWENKGSVDIYSDVEVLNPKAARLYSVRQGRYLSNGSWVGANEALYMDSGPQSLVVYKDTSMAVKDQFYNIEVNYGGRIYKDASTVDGDGTFNVTLLSNTTSVEMEVLIIKVTDLDGRDGPWYYWGMLNTDATPPDITVLDVTDPDYDPDGNELNSEGNWYGALALAGGWYVSLHCEDQHSNVSLIYMLWDGNNYHENVSLSSDGGSFNDSSTAPEGEINITIWAWDSLGNPAVWSMTIRIDRTPPDGILQVSAHPDSYTDDGVIDDDPEIYVNWSLIGSVMENGSGLAGYGISVNNPGAYTFVGNVTQATINCTPGMPNTIYVGLVDHVGNFRSIASTVMYISAPVSFQILGFRSSNLLIATMGDFDGLPGTDLLISDEDGASSMPLYILPGQEPAYSEAYLDSAVMARFIRPTGAVEFGTSLSILTMSNSLLVTVGGVEGGSGAAYLYTIHPETVQGGSVGEEKIIVRFDLSPLSQVDGAVCRYTQDNVIYLLASSANYSDGKGALLLQKYQVNPDITNNPPEVEIISPNGGEIWTGTKEISWYAFDKDGDNLTFTLLLSDDGGVTYPYVLGKVTNANIMDFDTTAFDNGTEYMVMIIAEDGHTLNNRSTDISDGVFTIHHPGMGENHPPEVTVISPNGGEVWTGWEVISWYAADQDGDTMNFEIYLSSDGGKTYETLIATLGDVRDYLWDTNSVPNGTEYIIKVVAKDGKGGVSFDTSNTVFEISHSGSGMGENSPPEVELISPNGGEEVAGVVNITWLATDADGDTVTISLYYRTFDTSWTLIEDDLENTGSYQWDTTGLEPSYTYRLKVVADDGKSQGFDISDDVFTILNNHAPKAVISSPEDGATFTMNEGVHFSASGSSDPDGDALTYTWSCPELGTLYQGTSADFTKYFSKAGNYTITLVVRDVYNLKDVRSITIHILPEGGGGGLVVSGINVSVSTNRTEVSIRAEVMNTGNRMDSGEVLIYAIDETGAKSLVKIVDNLTLRPGEKKVITAEWEPEKAGKYRFTVVLNDSNPENDRETGYFDLGGGGGGSGVGGQGGMYPNLLIGAVIAAIIVALVIFVLIKRRREGYEEYWDEEEEEPQWPLRRGGKLHGEMDNIDWDKLVSEAGLHTQSPTTAGPISTPPFTPSPSKGRDKGGKKHGKAEVGKGAKKGGMGETAKKSGKGEAGKGAKKGGMGKTAKKKEKPPPMPDLEDIDLSDWGDIF